MKLLKEFVTLAKNSKNNQDYLVIKKRKMKECGMNIDDILKSKVNKFRKFKEF